MGLQARDYLLQGHVEFLRVLDGLEGLFFQAGGATVPELRFAVDAIDQHGRIAGAVAVFNPHRNRQPVHEGAARVVTGSARESVVAREDGVEEEPPPQRDLLPRQRIVLRHRHIQVQPQRNLRAN